MCECATLTWRGVWSVVSRLTFCELCANFVQCLTQVVPWSHANDSLAHLRHLEVISFPRELFQNCIVFRQIAHTPYPVQNMPKICCVSVYKDFGALRERCYQVCKKRGGFLQCYPPRNKDNATNIQIHKSLLSHASRSTFVTCFLSSFHRWKLTMKAWVVLPHPSHLRSVTLSPQHGCVLWSSLLQCPRSVRR